MHSTSVYGLKLSVLRGIWGVNNSASHHAIEDRTVGAGDLLRMDGLSRFLAIFLERFDCLFDCLVAGWTMELKW